MLKIAVAPMLGSSSLRPHPFLSEEESGLENRLKSFAILSPIPQHQALHLNSTKTSAIDQLINCMDHKYGYRSLLLMQC